MGLMPGTGRRLWTYATGGKVSISPAAGGGLLLVGSNDGTLYAFAPEGDAHETQSR